MTYRHTGDYSETSYIPSCMIHLRIRLDTSIRYKVPTARAPADMLSTGPPSPFLFDETNGGGDGYSKLNGIVPLTCGVELGSYRKGGKYNFKLPFRDFPIDTRLIKAGSARIYAGTIPAKDFAEGLAQAQPKTAAERLYFRRKSLIQASDENLLISGPLDMPKLNIADGEVSLDFEGRDNVAILADINIDVKLMADINVKLPIDNVVQQILDRHPLVKDKKVDKFKAWARAEDWPDGVVRSPGTSDGITRVRKKADGRGARVSSGADSQSISYWDLIVNYCFLVGAVPYFQPDGALWIRPAVTLHDWQWAEVDFDPQRLSPFAGNSSRTIDKANGGIQTMFYRRMVYGRNIESLSFERKTSGVKARVVQVVSVDDDAEGRGAKQKLIMAEFPTGGVGKSGKGDKAKISSETADGSQASTDVLRVPVHGIRDKKALGQIAEAIFNEVMHQEVSGHCQTSDLASLGGTNGDPDLLRMRTGHPVQILTDGAAFSASAPHVADLLSSERRSFDEQVAAVKEKLGNDENFARAVVATHRDLVPALQNTFRVSGVKFDFNMAGDSPEVGIGFDFQNYIEAQYQDVNRKPAGQAAQPKATRV